MMLPSGQPKPDGFRAAIAAADELQPAHRWRPAKDGWRGALVGLCLGLGVVAVRVGSGHEDQEGLVRRRGRRGRERVGDGEVATWG
jgi:hypothetical protein